MPWSFASPWLLLWGAVAMIPVLIHLWSRRRYVETPWAATQFLLAAIRRHQRRLLIEQWMLLAIRVLVLLCLTVAIAEPIASGLSGVHGKIQHLPTHTILVIDTSYSMAYRSDDATRLTQAQALATRLVKQASPGDAFSLVMLSDPPEVIIGKPSASHRGVLNEISRLEISNSDGDLAATLQQVEPLLDGEFVQSRICFFSDLGKTTWDSSAAADWRSKLESLSNRTNFELNHIGSERSTENIAITSITLSKGGVNVGKPVSVDVQVTNYGTRHQVRQRVELSVDGRRLGEQFIDLEPSVPATVVFSVTFDVAGDHLLEASLDDDRLPLDNRRWLVASVRESTRVLCIQGRPHAAEYVAMALEADDNFTIQAEVATEHAILEHTLSDFDCIFLCNVARFTQEEATRLKRYAEQGGGLVFTLGDVVQTKQYNERLGDLTGLLPAALGDLVAEDRHNFDPLGYRHPLTQPFRGHERSGLLTAPTWRYIRLTDVADGALIALAFDTGDPAIVEWSVGQGRVVLFATAVSPESVDRESAPPTPWTALASWPSFPPLVHEVVQYATANRADNRNLLVGEPLLFPSSVASLSATLITPDDLHHAVQFHSDSKVWTHNKTDSLGVYRFVFDDETATDMLFVVNLQTDESDLAEISSSSLADLFEPDRHASLSTTATMQLDVPLFRIVLGLLLILLIIETLCAVHFGRAVR